MPGALIPETLRIGPYVITVHSTVEAWRDLKAAEAKAHDSWGFSDVARAAMWVDPDRDSQHVRDTVLHEVLHLCHAIVGGKIATEDAEEAMVATLSPLLLGALRDNPNLVAYLVASPG